jgi:hypothetical protein
MVNRAQKDVVKRALGQRVNQLFHCGGSRQTFDALNKVRTGETSWIGSLAVACVARLDLRRWDNPIALGFATAWTAESTMVLCFTLLRFFQKTR